MTNQSVFLYGSTIPLPKLIPLRAGPLSLALEDGDLRYIRLENREIVRRIYVAVRDHNWGTVPPEYSDITIDSRSDSFAISYQVTNRDPALGIDFVWRGIITGDPRGTITFQMTGEARSTFQSNRIGFCLLHPIRECAGTACIVEKVDGTVEQSHFPVAIAPQQPFIDIRAISHEVSPGLWAAVRFDGDTFEMEDQRAWTDASFKTYCTPLSLPFPREIKSGTTVQQSVTLTLLGDLPADRIQLTDAPNPITISRLSDLAVPLPRIGLGSASHGQPLTAHEIDRLRALHLSHLRVDLHLSHSDVVNQLRQASEESRHLDISLEAAIFLSDNAEVELERLKAALTTIRPNIRAWLVLTEGLKTTTETLIRLARRFLADYDLFAQFGGGTNVYFTELNRDRPTPATLALLDFVSYSANPQIHAFDNRSLSETCEALPHTLISARQFIGNKPLAISPLTLKPRFNAVATGPEPEVPADQLPRQVDPRQMSLFLAAWTLGSLKSLAESGLVQHITCFETSGWRGVLETEQGSPLPAKFPSIPGGVFPLYHVLADLGEMAGGRVLPIASARPLQVDGLLIETNGTARLLLANWTEDAQPVRIAFGQVKTIRMLNGTNVESAMRSPEQFRAFDGQSGDNELTLAPFAFARIDLL